MPLPLLETIAHSLNYGDLPETWRVPEIERFSPEKTLYDYQADALRNAARALYLYYGKDECDYQPAEPPDSDERRRHALADRYGDVHLHPLSVKQYENAADRRNLKENPVFRILSDFIPPQGKTIPYRELVNRMCFWMATGSGKTLVMVKLVEYLHRLKEHGEIPPYNTLILAPSDHLLGQIRRTVEEFNQSGLNVELVPLRDSGKTRQRRLGDAATVYYHRSDNVADVQKEALVDYRHYENGGKWYVLLDEAHKGGKEDSRRQAYYAVMARAGFLFNFSATFTDPEDVLTTVEKYNLEAFIKNGHGKNIYLNEREYAAFKNRRAEISHAERQRIVLKSLVTLAYVTRRVAQLRRATGLEKLYHLPLMLTLVNSVNTDVEHERNDLWAFFQTLREIATGAIDDALFQESKHALAQEWTDPRLLFDEDGAGILGVEAGALTGMRLTDVREAVFLSRRKSALQLIRSKDHKELAFQMKNADAPFALIRIGDTSKWRTTLLAGFEETGALQEESFFAGLERSPITILMGSRSFFESWDSTRPNVINFINIGGTDAKKFVVQSVGRGVRVETLPNRRRRSVHLPDGQERAALQPYHDRVQPPETLFLFATNRGAVKSVLEGLASERTDTFERVEGFAPAPRPTIGGVEMPLLVPEYEKTRGGAARRAPFAMSRETLDRFCAWLDGTSDAVLAVRDGLSGPEIQGLREVAAGRNVQIVDGKDYASLPFLQRRLRAHLAATGTAARGVRELDERTDIVHFRQIRAQLDPGDLRDLCEKIAAVSTGGLSQNEKRRLAGRFAAGEIDGLEFERRMRGTSEETFRTLKIENLPKHYYVPVVMAERGKADFIKHVVKEASEVRFLGRLERWLKTNDPGWDAWMFSKIDEVLDKVHVPYYDTQSNEYRRFLPDFVFWMCRGDDYRIVFVDPKGTEHASAYRKIDGYRHLFEDGDRPKAFPYRASQVQVGLLMFNAASSVPDAYRRFWADDPGRIFEDDRPPSEVGTVG